MSQIVQIWLCTPSVMRGVASADKASAITNLSHARAQGVLYKECRTLRKRSNTRYLMCFATCVLITTYLLIGSTSNPGHLEVSHGNNAVLVAFMHLSL